MFSEIINNFENITKFKLLEFFEKYKNFMQDDFSYLSDYFSGKTENISTEISKNYNLLLTQSHILIQTFENFSNKLSNCGFFELQQYCQNLNDTLEKINKLPKYNRVTKSIRGYESVIQINSDIGGLKTPQDLAKEIDSNGINETSLLLANDFQEDDWEIDKLSPLKATINNQTDLVVENILEEPIKNHVYGKDINKKITISNNDLEIKSYEDNVEQKIIILLNLNQGDIPEFPSFGKNKLQGINVGTYNYAELLKDMQNVFFQDDLFNSFTIEKVSMKKSDLYITCNIQTKYSYSVKKTFTL